MAGRRTNLALAVLLTAAFLTGWLAFGSGTEPGRWVTALHGILGLGLILLIPWKSVVVRRGLARSRAGRGASLLLSALVAITLLSGLGHAGGWAVSMGPVTAMQVHVGAALVALPLALWHVRVRPVRPRRRDLSRRAFLRSATLLGGGLAAYGVLEGMVELAGLPGSRRRFTGSHQRGSFRPVEMPVTQWLDDPVPTVEAEAWALEVRQDGRATHHRLPDLLEYEDRVQAVLDCTGGWYAEQDWEGVRLDRLVDPASGRSVLVRSVTGYARRLPMTDLSSLLLAVRMGGRPLSRGHGFPARLVAPGRRGFWWVKWVVRVEVDDRPWWWQPPFPLS